jgi:hypothetical protein
MLGEGSWRNRGRAMYIACISAAWCESLSLEHVDQVVVWSGNVMEVF